MNNSKGFIPLLAVLIVAVVGTGAVITYKNVNSLPESGKARSVIRNVENILTGQEKGFELPKTGNIVEPKACPQPNTWVKTFTEDQINAFLKNGLRNVDYSGYKINSGKVNLLDDGLETTINLNNNRSVYLNLNLINDGKDFEVREIKSTGPNGLSAIELTGIKLALNNADKIIWKYVDDYYKKSFVNIDISENNKLDIFFYTSEYLDCVGK